MGPQGAAVAITTSKSVHLLLRTTALNLLFSILSARPTRMLLCSTCNYRKTGLGPQRSPVADGLSRCSSIRLITFSTPPAQPHRRPPWPQNTPMAPDLVAEFIPLLCAAAVFTAALLVHFADQLIGTHQAQALSATLGLASVASIVTYVVFRHGKLIRRCKSGGGTVDGRAVFSNCHCSTCGFVAACPPRRPRPI